MATCNDCIHRTVCAILALPDAFENTKWDKEPCAHFKAAAVAPRAEVDLYKQLNDELEDELASIYDKLENARAEVAMEIFEELKRYIIDHCYLADYDVDAIWKHIDKLKKKYMEPEPPKGE